MSSAQKKRKAEKKEKGGTVEGILDKLKEFKNSLKELSGPSKRKIQALTKLARDLEKHHIRDVVMAIEDRIRDCEVGRPRMAAWYGT